MTFVAKTAFALLVVATFAAFFVAQRLKATPPVVQQVGVDPLISPNQDGRKDYARVSFQLKRGDEVTVTVVDADGDEIATLAEARRLRAGEQLQVRWYGRTDAGEPAPDGRYRPRLSLREQGRSITLARVIEKDTKPPSPRVLSVGPQTAPAPEVIPNEDGARAEVNLFAPGDQVEVEVWRTDVRPARRVLGPLERPSAARQQFIWDGRDGEGRRVPEGTYLVVVRSRDQAGNIGQSVRSLPPDPPYGEDLPGRGGIRVRYLSAQAPVAPVAAGERMAVGVASPDGPFSWSVRRAGAPRPRIRGCEGRVCDSRIVRFTAPRGVSGLYVFEARTDRRSVRVPFLVQARRERSVLVVLPAMTWQGRNRVDDDGDGWPDTLPGGRGVKTSRPYASGELPPDLARLGAPLLVHLDRQGRRYDVTTDVALARGDGPGLRGHRGVILAGEVRWLPREQQRALRGFARDGGTVLVAGPDSLRRLVRFTPGQRLVDPSPPADRTLFGARLRPVERRPGTVIVSARDDELQLFAGTEGRFPGFARFEETVAVEGGEVLATGVTEADAREVVVATREGKGIVVRTGLPELPARLDDSPELAALMERLWTLLSR